MSIGRVPGATGIQPSIVTAKGDLIVATASGSVTNQAVGSNNQVLTADSAQADGVKWANGSAATLTTTGDLLYASAANTPARLAIGSTDQVLKVSGGVPVWATPSSGALVLTGSSDFSAASAVVLSNCFSSTYDFYVMYLDLSAAANGSDWGLNLKMRSGSTNASTNYDRNRIYWNASPAAVSNSTGGTSFEFGEGSTTNPTRTATVTEFVDPAVARATKIFSKSVARSNAGTNGASLWFGAHTTATAYDSLEITAESGITITGTVRMYGYAKS